MGRRKVDNDKKKVKIAVSLDPDILPHLRSKCINVSSLVNKLLRDYMNGEKSQDLHQM